MENSIFGTLALIMAVAFLVETLVEAVFGRIIDHVPALQPYKWALVYVAVAAGIVGAFIYQFDLLYLLGVFVDSPVGITPFGLAVTGVAIGMGASYIHQFITRFFPKKDPELNEHDVRSYG
ncbi:hypothetical protein SY88_23750 [Clostridiales bacterium PH28_bin88]|nr:hypothetical protein SY88_23750 [Clostridiales bacterium PH28_bin88]